MLTHERYSGTRALRRGIPPPEQILTDFLKKGNGRVMIGRDGCLFHRPGIEALTGYGPTTPEPHSVSRDPALLDGAAPLEPVKHFAAQFQERGVALWLVPVLSIRKN